MARAIETLVEDAQVFSDQPAGPKATLTAKVRLANNGDQEIVLDADEVAFYLMGNQFVHLERLKRRTPPDGPLRITVPSGGAGELTVPLRIDETDVQPDATYHLSWEWRDESNKTAFDFL